jgi:17beta-estradiol 17-dehydrogenase / very-long-chain 3-oxoacyl-CoA reductase
VGLVSRTESKLVELCEEIEDKYKGGVKAKYLAIDISTDADSNYRSLESFVKSLGAPVTALINNVGQSHSIPVTFLQTPDEEMQNIITINTTATLKITKVVAPHIQNAVQERAASRGLILNMGSFAGLVPTPLLATYSGSKAFLQAWSIALARELEPSKIDVQLIESYLVTSAMSKIRRSSLMIPRPKEFVKATLSTVGRRVGSQERYASNTPYWSHALLHFLLDSTVGVYSKLAVGINYSTHADIRKRALRKAAREAEKLTKEK